jgi:REP-associated tyrosine transposase
MVRAMSQGRFRRTPAGVWSLGLHLVWWPKYRCRVLGGRVAARCGELSEQIAEECGWPIVAEGVMADRVRLLVGVGPTDAPASVARVCKGRTARVVREEFPYLCNRAKLWWSPWYFVVSVGCVWESRVRGCIEHRGDAVLAS